jgi:hypothetical protein
MMVRQLSWRGVAAEVGLLSVAATAHGPGCHAENTTHAVSGGFLCGPLNFRVGSAIEHATDVSVGWVAWRGAWNVRRVDASAQVESRVSSTRLVWTTKVVVGLLKETRLFEV